MQLTERDHTLIRRALTERAGALYDKAAVARNEETANSLKQDAVRCDELSHEFRYLAQVAALPSLK